MLACGQDGRPLPGPKSGFLSNTRKWIVPGDTCADREGRLKRLLQWRASGSGNPGKLLCLAAPSLRVHQVGLVSRLSVASHLTLPIFDLTQGPSWGHMPLLVRIGLGGWQNILWAIFSSFFLAPPKSFQLVLLVAHQFCVLYWDLTLWDILFKRLAGSFGPQFPNKLGRLFLICDKSGGNR